MGAAVNNAVGGFQAMTQDLLTVLNDIPFSIPPYFALLARLWLALDEDTCEPGLLEQASTLLERLKDRVDGAGGNARAPTPVHADHRVRLSGASLSVSEDCSIITT